MTALDDELVPAIKELINGIDGVGATVTFYEDAVGAFDATSQDVLVDAPTPHTPKISPPEFVRRKDQDDVERTVAKFLLAAQDLTFTPKLEMRVVIDNDEMRVSRADPIYSGVQICAWDIEAV